MGKTTKSLSLKFPKTPTGIRGLDEITGGGIPAGRPTLVCGNAGSGKTLLAVEYLVRGAIQYGHPGVCVMFEENAEELKTDVRSLGFDLDKLVREKKIVLDYVHIDRSEVDETGEYDLEGLFIRLEHVINLIGAKRIVLDTLEALFAGLSNHAILRAELRRLFRWLKDRGMTAVITGERGTDQLTRFGLEEYVADCVILLDHRVTDQISTRCLRVVKYRGSQHGTNEYPFLIGERGISVMPITSLQLDHPASTKRMSTGVSELDTMLGGGVYRGSSVLISGSAGTGKSILSVKFIEAACRRGLRALLFAFEESPQQIVRNMRSIGVNLEGWRKRGVLEMHAARPALHGLEHHLVAMCDAVSAFCPSLVVVDPFSNLVDEMDCKTVKPTLLRFCDFLKTRQITAVYTSLTHDATAGESPERSHAAVSSLMDTWLLLRNLESNRERRRTLFILKSRGSTHSNLAGEFVLNEDGVQLLGVDSGTKRVRAEMVSTAGLHRGQA